jgi:LmbE family N-acetylglucosaminyl deacetylase
MLLESDLFPYSVSPPFGNKSIVLAPHPDDETLGCGGTIKLLLNSKKQVKIIFLTSGEKADPSHPESEMRSMREKEAFNALKVLGVSDYEFFRFPDRELQINYKDAFERLLKVTEHYKPDTLYSPSMVELNPDHRITASLAMDIQKIKSKSTDSIKIVFYEVAIPLRPNLLVDISEIFRLKKKAIKKYKSQLKIIDYFRHITALNAMRTLTVQKAKYVEAFWCIKDPLSEEDIAEWLSYQNAISEHQ